MAEVNEGDVIRVTACLTSDWEGDIQNVWHIKQTSGNVSQEDFMTDAADALDTAYDYMDGVMPDSVTFDEIRAFNLTQDTPFTPVDWPTLTAGTLTGVDSMPAPVSGLGLLRTAVNKVLGKKYLGPFTETHSEEGEWTTSIVTVMSNLLNHMVTSWASGSGAAEAGVWSEVLEEWAACISTVAKAIPAYQRRRKKGRGS